MTRNRKKKPGTYVPPPAKYTYADMWKHKNAIPLTGLNSGLQKVIKSIMERGTDHSAFFNHGDNRDPALNGRGATPGHVRVEIYYQPATEQEVANGETISGSDILSGRRRLAARFEDAKDPFGQVWIVSFYLTNHPAKQAGVFNPNQNEYGQYTPVDPKR